MVVVVNKLFRTRDRSKDTTRRLNQIGYCWAWCSRVTYFTHHVNHDYSTIVKPSIITSYLHTYQMNNRHGHSKEWRSFWLRILPSPLHIANNLGSAQYYFGYEHCAQVFLFHLGRSVLWKYWCIILHQDCSFSSLWIVAFYLSILVLSFSKAQSLNWFRVTLSSDLPTSYGGCHMRTFEIDVKPSQSISHRTTFP